MKVRFSRWPAGAFAAEQLASAGVETVLFDEKAGVGKAMWRRLTYKLIRNTRFLSYNDTRRKSSAKPFWPRPRANLSRSARSALLIYSV